MRKCILLLTLVPLLLSAACNATLIVGIEEATDHPTLEVRIEESTAMPGPSPRETQIGEPTATPNVLRTPEGQPLPETPGRVQIAFTAERTRLRPGECTLLRWNVEGGFGVRLGDQPVERAAQREVCPRETTIYVLSVDAGDRLERREVVIVVEATGFDPATLRPFTAGVPYLDQYETGLYPGASNEMPGAHRQAGERIAQAIRPLDVRGQPDDQHGRILALAFGHSNAEMYFKAFRASVAERAAELRPGFELLNAAVGEQQLPEIAQLQGPVWDRARELTNRPGYSPLQVQVLFLHTTYHGCCNEAGTPPEPFPASMQAMERDLDKVLAHCVEVYPNLRIAYLTCDGFRHYTGFEPHVWQEAFAFKWLIARQIRGEPNTAYDGANRRLPWLAWGPYIWDNTWDGSFFTDGVHPAQKALAVFVDKYWSYLQDDSVARRWLFKPATGQ